MDLTDAQLTQIVMDQLTLVEQAYWDLAFADRNLAVQTQALAQAQGQVSSNERQAREGTLAPIDVVEAQTQVANFQQTVASAQQALTEAENRLKTLMLAGRDADIWNQALVPGDLAHYVVPSLALSEAVQLALSRRPELTALATERAQNDIDRLYFKDLAKPQINLAGAYTSSGLAGQALTTVTDPLSNTTNAVFFARLNELAALAGLPPLEPPEATTNTVPPFWTAGTGARSGTCSRAASPRWWCSFRWICRSPTTRPAPISRAPRLPTRRSSAGGGSSNRRSRPRCATRCRLCNRHETGSRRPPRRAGMRSSSTKASGGASSPDWGRSSSFCSVRPRSSSRRRGSFARAPISTRPARCSIAPSAARSSVTGSS